MAEPYGWLAALLAAQKSPGSTEALNIAARTGDEDVLSAAIAAAAGTGSGSPGPIVDDSIFPTPVSFPGLDVTAQMTPVTLDTPGASPVATGFDLFRETFDMLLEAEAAKRAAIDQDISIAQLFSELQRASPTQAADLATRLGLPGQEPDLGFANIFGRGANTTFGGKVGTQDLALPWSFSGKQLSFLQSAPNVAGVLGDISARFGRPDIFSESVRGLIPTSGGLAGMAW